MTEPADPPKNAGHARLERGLLLHRRAFFAALGVLLVANILVGSGWWSFWPMVVLSFAFSIHLFVVRSITVDEAWAEARADELLDKSYDFGHMRDISGRVVRRDVSVRIPEERE